MYDQVVKCQRAGLCLSEHFLIIPLRSALDLAAYFTRYANAEAFAASCRPNA